MLTRVLQVYESVLRGELSAATVAELAYASVFGGAVSYGLFFVAASSGSLVRLSSLTFLTPVFAAAAGFAVLHEELSPTQLLGAFVTLGGVLLVNGKANNENKAL